MESKLPLGIMKQATMKLDSFITDINEMKEDSSLDKEDVEALGSISEVASAMEATLLNMVNKECDVDEFISESVQMDVIDEFPESTEEGDILDEEVE